MYIYIHIHTCTFYVFVRLYVYTYTCVLVRMCVCIYVCMYVCIAACLGVANPEGPASIEPLQGMASWRQASRKCRSPSIVWKFASTRTPGLVLPETRVDETSVRISFQCAVHRPQIITFRFKVYPKPLVIASGDVRVGEGFRSSGLGSGSYPELHRFSS